MWCMCGLVNWCTCAACVYWWTGVHVVHVWTGVHVVHVHYDVTDYRNFCWKQVSCGAHGWYVNRTVCSDVS